MANIIKIDNATLKRTKRAETRKRKEAIKDEIVYFLIVCEGEKTEPNYFKSFDRRVKSKVHSIEIKGEGSNTINLVKRTIEARDKSMQEYDRVWVIFDKDNFPEKSFNLAIKLADENNIRPGWTNEAFELWYLLHFQFRNTAMSREDYKRALEKEINDAINKNSRSKKKAKPFLYKKNDPNMYALLNQYGDQSQAIKWADKLLVGHSCTNHSKHNPCTLVHQLVKELNGDCEILLSENEGNKECKHKKALN